MWKRFENTYYEVNALGAVRNILTGKPVKPFLNNGYLAIDVFEQKGGRTRRRMLVHRMVAKSFISNPENKPTVNHIDGIKTNNVVSNLEWATFKHQIRHALREGLIPKGSQKDVAKLIEDDVKEIQFLLELGYCDKEISDLYPVTRGVIHAIRVGKSWKHVSGKTYEKFGPNPVKKLSGEDIPKIRRLFKEGFNDAEIGRIYNVARGTINQIRQGKTWVNY